MSRQKLPGRKWWKRHRKDSQHDKHPASCGVCAEIREKSKVPTKGQHIKRELADQAESSKGVE